MYASNMGNNLSALDQIAANIKQPKIYGEFEDDKHYLSTLDLLLAATHETQNRYDFFVKQVLPQVTTNAMVDIGIGDGNLTNLLVNYFNAATIVDPSAHALDCVKKNNNRKDATLQKLVGSITEINLPASQFDLAVLSHTLYYIDTIHWVNVAKKILSSLKPNGLLVIVLNGGLDKDDIADKFGGKRLNIEEFIDNCRDQLNATSIDVSYSTECFTTQSLSAMRHIVGLHLYDVGAIATTAQLTEYLTAKNGECAPLYEFLVYQKFILVRK